MTDREKVIKGLEHCTTVLGCFECPYSVLDKATVDCKLLIDRDALKLLKEQEAVKPTVGGAQEYDGHDSWWYQCGECKMPIDYSDGFCRHCGRPVKWDG